MASAMSIKVVPQIFERLSLFFRDRRFLFALSTPNALKNPNLCFTPAVKFPGARRPLGAVKK